MRMMSAPASASIIPAKGAGPSAGQLDDAHALERAAHRAPPVARHGSGGRSGLGDAFGWVSGNQHGGMVSHRARGSNAHCRLGSGPHDADDPPGVDVVAPALDPHAAPAAAGRQRTRPTSAARARVGIGHGQELPAVVPVDPPAPRAGHARRRRWPARAQSVCCMTAISVTPRKWVASTSDRSTSRGHPGAARCGGSWRRPGRRPSMVERLDAAVHAGHQRESRAGTGRDPREGEPVGVGGVCIEEFVEHPTAW